MLSTWLKEKLFATAMETDTAYTFYISSRTNRFTIQFTIGDTATIVGQAIIHEIPHDFSQSKITPGLIPTWRSVITSDISADIKMDITNENTSP